jgi:hypothetical protein
LEIRHAIESAHDRVDRDDVLPRKSLEQEIEPARADRLFGGHPVFEEQAHARIS